MCIRDSGTPNYKVRVVQSKDETEWVKVEGAHEALVSYEDFMAVKTMMKMCIRDRRGESPMIPINRW